MGLLLGRHSNDPVGTTTTGHRKRTHGNNSVGEHRFETRSRGLFAGRSSGRGTTTGMGTNTNTRIALGKENKLKNALVANPVATPFGRFNGRSTQHRCSRIKYQCPPDRYYY